MDIAPTNILQRKFTYKERDSGKWEGEGRREERARERERERGRRNRRGEKKEKERKFYMVIRYVLLTVEFWTIILCT